VHNNDKKEIEEVTNGVYQEATTKYKKQGTNTHRRRQIHPNIRGISDYLEALLKY
jgi:hypothetical protein